MIKQCHRCNIPKPIDEFSKSVTYADGHSNWCKQCHSSYSSAYNAKRRDKVRESSRLWDARHPDRRRAICREWQRRNRYKRTLMQRIQDNLRTKLCRQLKAKKNRKPTIELLGYTIPELKKHLEGLFLPGMSWANYGKWHIDHKIPKAAFKIESPYDDEFKKCWALSNLQPLWAVDNLRKNKYRTAMN